jgi:lipopolysaccharide/colanic/teichoic acid biosynthesis glycosyltransferase
MKTFPALGEVSAVQVPRTPGLSPAAARRTGVPARRGRLDRYLRRNDSLLARSVGRLSRHRGPSYTRSVAKRVLDIAVGLPLAVIALPVIVFLAVANALLDPGRSPFFLQVRAGVGGSRLRVVKIRSMSPRKSGASPEIKRFAQFMRRHYLDELPQVFQVLAGELSLVGIRVLPIEVCNDLADGWSAPRFANWHAVYSSSRLGLTGVHQVFRRAGKEDLSRYHRDLMYQRSASLGFDLYLMWRTLRKAGR